VHAIDKHEKKKFIVVKTFKLKGSRKWFGCFWFFFHSLRWFLLVPPKDIFTFHKVHATTMVTRESVHDKQLNYFNEKYMNNNKNQIDMVKNQAYMVKVLTKLTKVMNMIPFQISNNKVLIPTLET
jgi:hypothetical protein